MFLLKNARKHLLNFFYNKIVKINKDISDKILKDAIEDIAETKVFDVTLDNFEPATVKEITDIIGKSNSSTCSLDPIPTKILKQCPSLIPWITDLVNQSLSTGSVPQSLKTAIVRPLIKKANLDSNVYKNFRPVSNLSFISKITERVVASRINKYVEHYKLLEISQSAYRKYHSTETAILKIQNDILTSLNNKKMTALILLDLSAAFDTINHNRLLRRLKDRYGILGTPLAWLNSYLKNRFQFVAIDTFTSDSKSLDTGVPQGSVLGPLLFSLYVSPISEIARRHGICVHSYADDTQLYFSFLSENYTTEIFQIEICLQDIRKWMLANFLKLNDDKTEFLLIYPKSAAPSVNSTIKIGDSIIHSVDSAKNLGVILDKFMDMNNFITHKCKCAMFALYSIAKIRKYLDVDTTRTLVQALITSQLDYANSTLYGLPQKSLHRIQLIQNSAARLIMQTSKRESITPILQQLHWLPIKQRLRYKILLLTFKSIHHQAPEYLSTILIKHEPSRTLRSSSRNLLVVPKSKSKLFDRSFSVAAPTEWNNIPDDLKLIDNVNAFKSKLKTFLFHDYYNI